MRVRRLIPRLSRLERERIVCRMLWELDPLFDATEWATPDRIVLAHLPLLIREHNLSYRLFRFGSFRWHHFICHAIWRHFSVRITLRWHFFVNTQLTKSRSIILQTSVVSERLLPRFWWCPCLGQHRNELWLPGNWILLLLLLIWMYCRLVVHPCRAEVISPRKRRIGHVIRQLARLMAWFAELGLLDLRWLVDLARLLFQGAEPRMNTWFLYFNISLWITQRWIVELATQSSPM